MKNSFTLFSLFIIAHFSQAQSVERSVIGSAGGVVNASGSIVTWTVGETVIQTASGGSVILTQGYQQPEQTTTSVKSMNTLNGLKVYPNPSNGVFQLEAQSATIGNLSISVTDASGKLAYQSGISGNSLTNSIDLSNLPGGIYLLKVADANQLTNTFKLTIIK